MLYYIIISGKEILPHYVTEWKITGHGIQDLREYLSWSRYPVVIYLIPTKFAMHQKKGEDIKDRGKSHVVVWVK